MRGRHGFTLIELLVVIAIIAILAAILFPVFSQAREKARQAGCTSNLRNMSMAFQQYAQDYDEQFPLTTLWFPPFGGPISEHFYVTTPADSRPAPDWVIGVRSQYWSNTIVPYLRNFQVYACPSAIPVDLFGIEPSILPGKKFHFSYYFNRLVASYHLAGIRSPVDVFIMSEAAGNQAIIGAAGHWPAVIAPPLTAENFPNRYMPPAGRDTSRKPLPAGDGEDLPPCGTIAVAYVISYQWQSPWTGLIWSPNQQVHSGGTVYTYTDGHVKWNRNPHHWDNSMWAMIRQGDGIPRYSGSPDPGPFDWYWWSGCAPQNFRPIND